MAHEDLEAFEDLAELPRDLARYTDPRNFADSRAPGLPGRSPGQVQLRLRQVGPYTFAPQREVGGEPPEVLERLVLMLRGTPLTSKPPGYTCPPYWARSRRATSATQTIAPGATVRFADVFVAGNREFFRFVGLLQRVSDPLAAADSTWRVLVNDAVAEEIGGIVSSATGPAPIFVHARSGARVSLTVTNAAAVPIDASAVLLGYTYHPQAEVPGQLGTIADS